MVVLYIILFIVCLSTLIAVHELGHLLTAKIFKVYCFEYALGFGPKLFSKKRKNGETYFSIRAVPFGGFVSMYGESDSIPEGLSIDPSRSLLAIKKWKRAIIMVSGVTMNFLLAILIFFTYNVAFPVYTGRYGHVTISKNSIASEAGLKSKDSVYAQVVTVNNTSYVFYDDETLINYPNVESKNVFFGFNYSSLSLKDTSLRNHAVAYEVLTYGSINPSSYTEISYQEAINNDFTSDDTSYYLNGYLRAKSISKIKNSDKYEALFAISENYDDEPDKIITAEYTITKDDKDAFVSLPVGGKLTVAGTISTKVEKEEKINNIVIEKCEFNYPNVTGNNYLSSKNSTSEPSSITFNMYLLKNEHNPGQGVATLFENILLERSGSTYYMPKKLGISMQLDKSWNNFGDAIKNTFVDFGNSATLIVKGLGRLFTSSEGWKDIGGIIAIGVSTTRTLEENGFGLFLYYWALISVNLGIVNLLPFPGLDGWQLLVIGVEAVFRKEIPAKVKNIVSAVGVLLLLGLMVLILVKDIITFI